ncbi:beta-lactamase family protein [Paenibacillus sp. KQZ6P-2]|uniref:Beta-lactamase family protein n=1 Tax=Paenibacillus mangrovi TaxID=2931978 RepID=A0A9X2B4R9_9BACL|nr:serine hydrolase [Paenibacillus mangrovi]MCJ8014836.1 beta-lactamase family protein [Paenibacillus mangrovi]
MLNTDVSLPRKSPEELGISPKNVIEFLDGLKAHNIELHSFMLLRNGHVAAEGWWSPYAPELPHMLFSLSKSFTSTAIGMAVHEGILTLDDAVISYFPEDLPDVVSSNLAAMQIRHLLMMGTGHDKDTMGALDKAEDGNWAKAFLQLPVVHEPGTHFLYNTGATYMLSAILQKASRQNLLEFLHGRLFEPLGISNPTWQTCPRGIHTGGFGLSITTEDIAKFGQLYLQKGVWHGQRLIEESWIDEATGKQISNGNGGDSDWTQGYGYQFWRCRHDVYRGDGAFGQFCIVFPQYDAVIAITAGTSDMQAILNCVWDHLLDAFLPEPVEEDEYSYNLKSRLQELHLEPPQFEEKSEQEARVSGRIYTLEKNELNLDSLRIEFEQDRASLLLERGEGSHQLSLGRGDWVTIPARLFDRQERQVAGSFTWKTPYTLLLTIRGIETPFCLTYEVQYNDEDSLEIDHRVNVSSAPTDPIRGRASLE